MSPCLVVAQFGIKHDRASNTSAEESDRKAHAPSVQLLPHAAKDNPIIAIMAIVPKNRVKLFIRPSFLPVIYRLVVNLHVSAGAGTYEIHG